MARPHDLVYALRAGTLVSIHQVRRGLQRDCLCPACGSPLIAKKGGIRRHHFAHVTGSACETAAESALHLLAKKVMCTPGTRLPLPTYEIVGRRRRGSNAKPMSETVPGVGGAIIQVAEGQKESRFEGFTADSVISVLSGDGQCRKELIVEIAVTNPCSKAKIRRIAAVGTSAIEIDLCDFPHNEGMSIETVQKVFLEPGRVKWLFHPKQLEVRKRLARKLRQRTRFDVLLVSPPVVSETQFQSRGGSVTPARGSGWDAFFEDYVARYGVPDLEDLRQLQNRFFGPEKKRRFPFMP